MIGYDLKEFAQEVHQNAVEHGWWEGEREVYEIVALIHSEWSEALEEYRAGMPDVWHKCPYNGSMCETQNVHDNNGGCSGCTPDKRKPEGIAVELIDGCIRILDYLAHTGFHLTNGDVEQAMAVFKRNRKDVPYVVAILHKYTAIAANNSGYWLDALGAAFSLIEQRGGDPFAIMLEKHEFNKTRPYKHGGKVC